MRGLERNKREIHYALFVEKVLLKDANGNKTGEHQLIYKPPVKLYVNVSPASGNADAELFGNLTEYDKVIVLYDTKCPIDESAVLWIDKPVEYDSDGNPLFDYIVKRVAKSLNVVAIAVAKAARS